MKERKLFIICSFFLLIMLIKSGITRVGDDKDPPPDFAQYIPDERQVSLRGTVQRKEETEKGYRLYLKDNSITYYDHSVRQSKIILYTKNGRKIKTGNRISVMGRISYFECAENPGNFNLRRYYRIQGIRCSVMAEKVDVVDSDFNPVGEWLYEFRQDTSNLILHLAGEKQGGLFLAILLGEKGATDPDVKLLYQKAGIAHVLAISGLHLSLIVLSFYTLVRKLSGSFLAGGIAGFLFLLAYTTLTGPGISVVRAGIMFVLKVGADLCGRVYDVKNAFILAMSGVILWRNEAFLDIGFQLSFGAIAGIIFLYPFLYDEKKEHVLLYKEILSGIAIQIATLPVMLYQFSEIPLYAIFLNLLILPLMPVLLGGAIAATLIGNLSLGLGTVVMKLPCLVLELYELICEGATVLPFSCVVTGQPSLWGILIYCLLVGIGLYFWKQTKGLFLVAAVLVLFSSCPFMHQKGVEITAISVGQGDGIYIRDETLTCLSDGGSSTVKEVGSQRIVPFLKCRGVAKLDYVFISHGDADHYNGVQEILENPNLGVKIEHLILPVQEVWDEKLEALALLAKEKNVPVMVMKPGDKLKGENIELTCLFPSKEEGEQLEKGNETSLVLDLKCGKFSMLLTGDVEKEGEKKLQEHIVHTYTVLKAGHHGSKNSSKEEFLEVVKPSYCILSAGKHNSYGHPHKETVDRLNKAKVRSYDTSKKGAVIIKMKGKKVEKFQIIQYN